MNADLLQQKIYMGYAKAALRIGHTFGVYRPNSQNNPVAGARLVTSLPASFNAEDMKYGKPNKYGKPTWFCLIDGRQTQVGDYLIHGTETYFIAAQQLALPILAVECNRVINVLRPQQLSGVGAQGYGGNTTATETLLMQQWPASVLQGTKGEHNEVQLPGDVRNPWWAMLFPAWPGVTLRTGDIITDELVRRYVVSSAELTDSGWRITAMQAQT
jgi:hypothetical protein